MNITTTATSNTTTTTSVKTPEAETENPTRIQPVKPLSFSNGVLKRHQPLHLLGNPQVVVTYKECLSAPPPENMSLAAANTGAIAHPNGRKRFRTKFTQDQKEKMYEFAEKVGWKIQKRDEDLISDFCNEIGVDRGVLKVWMHNNKSTLGKREANTNGGISGGVGIGGENGVDVTATASDYHHQLNGGGESESNLGHHHQLHSSDRVSAAQVVNVTTNGSSSSS
ncbi:hypothetical protein RJ639_030199 [Escallonia herrerae]|uniref:Uncharacterized protein n=1 Tax=Escallonia herrerae TaxID=1293975 RepID=A0AA88X1W1_9ASTE|nr:hypothetical protein RJ639_035789 [Escallonia herrerae]KAK3036630.1 hypothetical protein RJ639_030199 [Escallonia herrerae]